MKPGAPFPEVAIRCLGGTVWKPNPRSSASFSLLIIYRGYHCAICASYLRTLHEELSALRAMDVATCVASADTPERAESARDTWALHGVDVGYGLDAASGKALGLYRSSARKDIEPAYFFEPATFLLSNAGELIFVATQNMPFARPAIRELRAMIETIAANAIPARGTVDYV